ncbi:MAG: hypothetical protein U0232_34060 [Thermomicrobiales bacterium]
MGTSFVEYREVGFWASDGSLDLWLTLLVREIDSRTPIPTWLAELREHWQEQATFGGVGCISLYLDEYITDDTRRHTVLSVAGGALARLTRYGETVTRDELNTITESTPRKYWTEDLPVVQFAALGNAFIALLNGEITTTAATSRGIP